MDSKQANAARENLDELMRQMRGYPPSRVAAVVWDWMKAQGFRDEAHASELGDVSPTPEHVTEVPDGEDDVLRVGAHDERLDAVEVDVDEGGTQFPEHACPMRAAANTDIAHGEPSDVYLRAGALSMYRASPRLSMAGATTMFRDALLAASAVTEQGEAVDR